MIRKMLHTIKHPKQAIEEKKAQEKSIIHKNGLYPNKTFYVIRCNLPECGLFAIFMYILDHIAYAHDHGFIPVIDLEQYECLYKENEPVHGETDPWRYYFDVSSDIVLSDLPRCKNVIYSAVRFPHYKAIYYYQEAEKNILPPADRISELHDLTERYIPLRMDLRKQLEQRARILQRFNHVLGIHVRGTDMYTEGKQHPIPTGETKDFTVIDGVMKKHNLDGIFLCTDTESTVQMFHEHYGDKLIMTDAVRQSNDNKVGIHKDASLGNGRKYHRYNLGLEAITDMYLLSKCAVLLCGPSNVPFTALIYNNNNYEDVIYCP